MANDNQNPTPEPIKDAPQSDSTDGRKKRESFERVYTCDRAIVKYKELTATEPNLDKDGKPILDKDGKVVPGKLSMDPTDRVTYMTTRALEDAKLLESNSENLAKRAMEYADTAKALRELHAKTMSDIAALMAKS